MAKIEITIDSTHWCFKRITRRTARAILFMLQEYQYKEDNDLKKEECEGVICENRMVTKALEQEFHDDTRPYYSNEWTPQDSLYVEQGMLYD